MPCRNRPVRPGFRPAGAGTGPARPAGPRPEGDARRMGNPLPRGDRDLHHAACRQDRGRQAGAAGHHRAPRRRHGRGEARARGVDGAHAAGRADPLRCPRQDRRRRGHAGAADALPQRELHGPRADGRAGRRDFQEGVERQVRLLPE